MIERRCEYKDGRIDSTLRKVLHVVGDPQKGNFYQGKFYPKIVGLMIHGSHLNKTLSFVQELAITQWCCIQSEVMKSQLIH